jgi:Cu2+-containing amine oxidase
LAEQSITSKNLKTDEHLYFINGELFRDKSEENKQMTNRFVLLTYYRYDGDVTIKALVDSTREKVVKVEAVPHIPTPLSQEEFGIAKNLALAEPTVQKALTSYGTNVVIEPLVVRSLSETERTQRLVRLLFKIGRDYLREPIVHVDLITKKVTVEKFESPSQPNH